MRVFKVEFDGGSTCNVPSKGYGKCYGSFMVSELAGNNEHLNDGCWLYVHTANRMDHGINASANVGELLTALAGMDYCRVYAGNTPLSEVRLLMVGDSRIALKWCNPATNRGRVSKNASPEFIEAASKLVSMSLAFKDVRTVWVRRERMVQLFGH